MGNCKRSTECKFVYFPHTSLLLQNPYLKIAKKNRKCHLSDFLMSLKMFKKSSKNSKIIFFTTYFSSSYPMLNMYACLTIFSLRTTTTGKRTPAAATKLQKTF